MFYVYIKIPRAGKWGFWGAVQSLKHGVHFPWLGLSTLGAPCPVELAVQFSHVDREWDWRRWIWLLGFRHSPTFSIPSEFLYIFSIVPGSLVSGCALSEETFYGSQTLNISEYLGMSRKKTFYGSQNFKCRGQNRRQLSGAICLTVFSKSLLQKKTNKNGKNVKMDENENLLSSGSSKKFGSQE